MLFNHSLTSPLSCPRGLINVFEMSVMTLELVVGA